MKGTLAMNDALFGFSNESRAILEGYLHWSRLACESLKRGVSLDASSHQAGNLLQETYALGELKTILSGHAALVLHSLDARMEKFVASSAEVLRAVLREADRQRVAIDVDVNALLRGDGAATTNAGGLLAGPERQLLGGPRGRLVPLTVADMDGEAHRQLAESGEEIRRLREKVHRLTDLYAQAMNVRSVDTEGVLSTRDDVFRATGAEASHKGEDEHTHQTVEQLRAELAVARRELSVRLNQSTQYQQLKSILAKKNEQIKTLRARLAVCDPAFLNNDDGIGDSTFIEEGD